VPAAEGELPAEAGLPFGEGARCPRSDGIGVPSSHGEVPSGGCAGIPIERRLKLSFFADAELLRGLDRARRLLKGRCPSGRLDEVLSLIVRAFLRARDPAARRASAERPARERQTRRVPRWVKDRVWKRDGARCGYVSESGRRCEATDRLEYDHIRPWARGGSSDDPDNIRLLCRAHNMFAARRTFGERVPSRRG
jgi:hypothetical protein